MISMFCSHEVYCLACEKREGNISLESLSNSIMILYCDKHAPQSRKRNHSGDSTTAGPSVCNSDSNSSSSSKPPSSKRRSSCGSKQEETPSKCKPEALNGIITDDSSDENGPDTDMALFAPLESDLEGSESQLIRRNTETPTASTSAANPQEVESKDGNKDNDETDCESESLLILVKPDAVERDGEGSSFEDSPLPAPAEQTVPQKTSSSPDVSKLRGAASLPPRPGTPAASPAPPETISLVSSPSLPSSPPVLPSEPGPAIDSAGFWRSCNAAGCTGAIFTDFIDRMNNISTRIQSDQASQEDYDLALTVMEASGKLKEFVTKQQEELRRKQAELQRAAEAMKGVVSALRR